MNRKYYAAFAASAVCAGAVVLTATEASAMLPDPEGASTSQRVPSSEWPDEGSGYPQSEKKAPEPNYPNYDPNPEGPAPMEAAVVTSPDDTTTEVLQSGAAALGGAAIALGSVWLYRRHQLRTT